MGTLANSENQDEMPQNMAFCQGLHCLLGKLQALSFEFPKYENFGILELSTMYSAFMG